MNMPEMPAPTMIASKSVVLAARGRSATSSETFMLYFPLQCHRPRANAGVGLATGQYFTRFGRHRNPCRWFRDEPIGDSVLAYRWCGLSKFGCSMMEPTGTAARALDALGLARDTHRYTKAGQSITPFPRKQAPRDDASATHL